MNKTPRFYHKLTHNKKFKLCFFDPPVQRRYSILIKWHKHAIGTVCNNNNTI